MTKKEDKPLVKTMFKNTKGRGPKDKTQVTNMYTLVAIPDRENKRHKMLDQQSQRKNKWLSRAVIAGVRHQLPLWATRDLRKPGQEQWAKQEDDNSIPSHGITRTGQQTRAQISGIQSSPRHTRVQYNSKYYMYGRSGQDDCRISWPQTESAL